MFLVCHRTPGKRNASRPSNEDLYRRPSKAVNISAGRSFRLYFAQTYIGSVNMSTNDNTSDSDIDNDTH